MKDFINKSFTKKGYKWLCSLTRREQEKYLSEMGCFSHLGAKRKVEQVKFILDGTPNTSRTRKKSKEANTSSDRGGNAKDTSKRSGNNKPEDTGIQEGKKS